MGMRFKDFTHSCETWTPITQNQILISDIPLSRLILTELNSTWFVALFDLIDINR